MPAASITVRPLLLGPVRALHVVAVTPRALYLADAGRLVALLAPDAVRVPFGVVVDARGPSRLPGARVGDLAAVGEGAVRLAGLEVRPLRWWDPSVPRVQAVAGRLAATLAGLLPRPLDPPDLVPGADALVAALHRAVGDPSAPARAALADAVRALVGRGPGLTPAGDDVLAGALCALCAVRPDPAARGLLADAVLAQADRTTPVSAALLAEAAAGRTVPQVVDVLRSLGDRRQDRTAAAVAALVGVGHTSGTAFGYGLVAGLRAAAPAGRVAA